MKKITKILFAFPLFLNWMVKKTNWYNNIIPDKANYPDNDWYRIHLERNYDVVNLGSSSGVYDFDYTGLNVKAFNWALQPQSLEYSFKVLKMYFSILRQKGVVFIPFSPFSGLSVTGKWAETAFDKYFDILSPTLIDDYKNVRLRRLYPLFTQPKIALKSLFKDVPQKRTIRQCKQCKSDKDFIADARRWIEIWKREFKIENLDTPLSKENIKGAESRKQLLSEMIDFCLIRNLRPILVLPPIHPTLSKFFTQNFRKNYIYSFIKEANIQQNPVLDYFDDKRFLENKDFDNAFFLSQDGARKFTKIVLTDAGIITK